MTSYRRYALGLAAIVTGAVALPGCGGSGPSKSTSSSASSAASAASAGNAASGQGTLTTYRGPGYELSVPRAWAAASNHNAQTGKTAANWNSKPHGYDQISVVSGSVSAMGGTAGQQVTQYLSYNRTVPTADRLRITVSREQIPGAKQAVLMTVRGQGKVVHYGQTLSVQTTNGTVIYLTVDRYAGDESFDPQPIIDSFKLTG